MDPFVALVVAATLRTIPKEQIEWGKTQGASYYLLVKQIYLPYVVPLLAIVGTLRLIDCLKTYESIWTLFANNAETASISIRITTLALETRNYGMGAALSVLYIIFASILITPFAKRIFGRKLGYS